MQKLFAGEPVTGWKFVEGRSNRKYKDEAEVAKAMIKAGYDEALIYERSLLGITAMEKAFGKKEIKNVLGDLIIKPKGKATLAAATDKRPEYKPEELILDAFDDVEE